MAEDLKLDSFLGGFRHQDPKLGIGSPPKTPIFCHLSLFSLQGVPKNALSELPVCETGFEGLRVGGL